MKKYNDHAYISDPAPEGRGAYHKSSRKARPRPPVSPDRRHPHSRHHRRHLASDLKNDLIPKPPPGGFFLSENKKNLKKSVKIMLTGYQFPKTMCYNSKKVFREKQNEKKNYFFISFTDNGHIHVYDRSFLLCFSIEY